MLSANVGNHGLEGKEPMSDADIRIKVGLRIKELRSKLDLSQEGFAWSIGMARSYLAEIETGKRNVSLVNLEKIAQGLNVSLAEFFSSGIFE